MSFWGKNLNRIKEHLGAEGPTEVVKYGDMSFKIKKIDPLNYLEGSKSVLQMFMTYEEKVRVNKDSTMLIADVNKLKAHYTDVIIAGVIEPKIVRKEPAAEGELYIEDVFKDWEMASFLFESIYGLTYGKKKIQSAISPNHAY